MAIERPYLATLRQFHFIGIGGIGMSGIAQLLLELGYEVSGSDLKPSILTRRLTTRGATVHEGHDASHLDGAQAVVVSSAVPDDNLELSTAQRRELPIIHRSEMLSELMARQRGIAVSGTHGKSTTTSMIGLAFRRQGMDPTVVVGGELNDLGGNAKLGEGDYFIAEVDESDGSLLNLHPDLAIVTNIEAEHLDYYGSEAELIRTFERFLRGMPAQGKAVVCGDCPNALNASDYLNGQRITYGFGDDCQFSARAITCDGHRTRYEALSNGEPLGEVTVGVPGRQNILNSLAALATASEADIPLPVIQESLAAFHGIDRRFQRIGEANGVLIIDDYAHHPSEIQATLRAARDGFPERRLVCAFQPHRYTRTKLLREAFGEAFGQADVVFITDVYAAGESPLEGITGETLVEAVHGQDPERDVRYVADRQGVCEALHEVAQPGDLFMTLGAGDIWRSATELADRLGATVEAELPHS